MSANIEGTAVRSTAATRLVFEDLKVPALLEELTTHGNALESALRELNEARESHADLTREREMLVRELTLSASAEYYADTELKHSGAELERRVKATLLADNDVELLDNKLHEGKLVLDDAQAEYDSARYQHRTSTTKVNASAQILNFLASSKVARSNALSLLGEL